MKKKYILSCSILFNYKAVFSTHDWLREYTFFVNCFICQLLQYDKMYEIILESKLKESF